MTIILISLKKEYVKGEAPQKDMLQLIAFFTGTGHHRCSRTIGMEWRTVVKSFTQVLGGTTHHAETLTQEAATLDGHYLTSVLYLVR